MPSDHDQIEDLVTLNEIATTLNRAVDVRSVLNTALARLVELMGLETGWIFVWDPAATGPWWGSGYVLAAHHNLPPALALDSAEAWAGSCDCQGLCARGELTEAYTELRCSRLAKAQGDRRGLSVHASAPLCAGERLLGILNVAGPGPEAFSRRALALLANAGSQMGVALERARLFDLLQEQRIDEQAALLDLSNQLLSRLDRDDLLAYLVEEARRLLKADGCALLLPGERPGCLDFMAASGWRSDPVAEGRCAPAGEESGPGWVMHSRQPLLVEDLQAHDPVPWLPDWLRAEGFRGHAAVPLVVDGRAVGVLILNARQPRMLDEAEMRFLRLIANQAAIAVETARLHQEEIQRQQFESELAVGREIQLSLLPRSCPLVPGWECAAAYHAAHLVSGDFYDFFDLPGETGRLGLVIADVAGKGVPAALFMALSRTMIRTTALSGRSPAAALCRANDLIRKDSRSELFVSVFYAVLDTASGHLVFANAGHPPPIWLHAATGQMEELHASGIVLGVLEDIDLDEGEVHLAPGDLLVFYTDGITEAIDEQERPFGVGRLMDVIAASRAAGAAQVLKAVVGAVESFAGDTPRSDDLTLFVIKRDA